ncbi:hypothetical protein A165_00035 [Vibrio tasmaniensis ZS-17]|uniref:stealth family protein n=1 Tax=Vibrio tasmaniensis TaxID=212663 RepID=UPI0002D9FBB9|nr:MULTISPECIES: stealth family protein [Vibrio]OED69552.1 hypothetical protein A165_00035 [Vibrio tasmaniensis ZS-17]PMH99347.1 hypothetical protein BCU54_20570 [Vibrio lentus]
MNYKKKLVKLVKTILGESGKDKYFALKLSYFKFLSWSEKGTGLELKPNCDLSTVSMMQRQWHNELSDIFLSNKMSFRSAFDGVSFVANKEFNIDSLVESINKGNFSFSNSRNIRISNQEAIISLKKGVKVGVYQQTSNNGVVIFSEESSISIYPNENIERIDEAVYRQYDFDVDVVYTWVDGDDPKWLEKKNFALGNKTEPSINSADSDSRFRNRNELMYSIRSLQMYADWVRNIYIVTDSQVPTWINEHSNIKVIDHKDIFPDREVLPVFNSHAIEACLHRINGLSENFIYFNDDVFLGKKANKSDFFCPFGHISKCFYSNQAFIPMTINTDTLPVDIAAINNADFLESNYGYRPVRKFKHTPIPLKKTVLVELEAKHPEIFFTNRGAKFRSRDDYSIVSALHHHYGIIHGKVAASGIKYDYVNLGDDSYKNKLQTLLFQPTKHRKTCFCINDVNSDNLCQNEIGQVFIDIVDKLYPFKSKFEL